MIKTKTFEEAFKRLNEEVYNNWHYLNDSRIGKTREITNIGFEVSDPSSYEFTDTRINRIKYDMKSQNISMHTSRIPKIT